MNKNKNEDIQQFFTPKIAVLGLGYVGLPLFCLFSKHYHCVGFDSDNERTTLLSRGIDAKRCEKEEEFLMAAMDHVWNTSVVGRKVKDEVDGQHRI